MDITKAENKGVGMKRLVSRVGFGLLAVSYAGYLHAGGSVDFLEVDSDVVLFSTSESKSGLRPECVDIANNEDLWSISLATDSGRATYSLILTAMAKGETAGLNIESANDCADRIGIERASKVNITSNTSTVNSGGTTGSATTVGIYRRDGTRQGTLVNAIDEYNWLYVDDSDSTSVKRHTNYPQKKWDLLRYYYPTTDCSGDPMDFTAIEIVDGRQERSGWGEVAYHPFIQDGKMYTRNYEGAEHITIGSELNLDNFRTEGTCRLYTNTRNPKGWTYAKPVYDSLCGDQPCFIRED